jgi:hypothetical protein
VARDVVDGGRSTGRQGPVFGGGQPSLGVAGGVMAQFLLLNHTREEFQVQQDIRPRQSWTCAGIPLSVNVAWHKGLFR